MIDIYCGAEARIDPTEYAALEARTDLDDLQANDLFCDLPQDHPHLVHARCMSVIKGTDGQDPTEELWATWPDGGTPKLEAREMCALDLDTCSLWKNHPNSCTSPLT